MTLDIHAIKRAAERENNRKAVEQPVPGDFWTEMMFVPYFIVVAANYEADRYAILCAWEDKKAGVLNARVDNNDNTWCFDCLRTSVVSSAWIKKTVMYSTMPEFVASVNNTEKTRAIVREWMEANPGYSIVQPVVQQHAEWWLGV